MKSEHAIIGPGGRKVVIEGVSITISSATSKFVNSNKLKEMLNDEYTFKTVRRTTTDTDLV